MLSATFNIDMTTSKKLCCIVCYKPRGFFFVAFAVVKSLFSGFLLSLKMSRVLLPASFRWLTNKQSIHRIARLPKKLNRMFIHSFGERAYLRLNYSSFPCSTSLTHFSVFLSPSLSLSLPLCLSSCSF